MSTRNDITPELITHDLIVIGTGARGRILGAHLIGPDASGVINLFGFAMRSGLTADAIRHATFTYPSAASDLESMLR